MTSSDRSRRPHARALTLYRLALLSAGGACLFFWTLPASPQKTLLLVSTALGLVTLAIQKAKLRRVALALTRLRNLEERQETIRRGEETAMKSTELGFFGDLDPEVRSRFLGSMAHTRSQQGFETLLHWMVDNPPRMGALLERQRTVRALSLKADLLATYLTLPRFGTCKPGADVPFPHGRHLAGWAGFLVFWVSLFCDWLLGVGVGFVAYYVGLLSLASFRVDGIHHAQLSADGIWQGRTGFWHFLMTFEDVHVWPEKLTHDWTVLRRFDVWVRCLRLEDLRHNILLHGLVHLFVPVDLILAQIKRRLDKKLKDLGQSPQETFADMDALLAAAVHASAISDIGCWPSFLDFDDRRFCHAQNLKHPLLLRQGRPFSAELHRDKRLEIVTGDYGSGKTTYLQSILLNLALARAGACCTADAFGMSKLWIHTMLLPRGRLGEGLSKHQWERQELARMRQWVENLPVDQNLLLLADELLAGATAKDRLHLIQTQVLPMLPKLVGWISTHDPEVIACLESSPRVARRDLGHASQQER